MLLRKIKFVNFDRFLMHPRWKYAIATGNSHLIRIYSIFLHIQKAVIFAVKAESLVYRSL